MQRPQNILFISLNRHQHRYFTALGLYLSPRWQVFHVLYAAAGLRDAIRRPDLPAGLDVTPAEFEEITEFLRIKARYRQFGPLRRLLHSRMALENQAYGALRFFYHYITTHGIDLVCVWNGTLVPLAAATLVARKLGRKTLFFENGYLPRTTTVDPCGVNNRGSLVGKSRDFYAAVTMEPDKLRRLYQAPAAIRPLKTRWYQRLLKRKPQGSPEKVVLPARYVLLPFQVHDDTQVLLHSPVIKTMPDLARCVVDAVRRHNAATGDDLWVVVKEHPSDFGRVDYSGLADAYRGEKVLFLRYFPTPELIRQARGVVTINSSVGIEALLRHKPVFTLGNAFYNVPGVVTHVAPPEELATALTALDRPVDHGLIDKFLYYLRYHYLVPGSWRQPDAAHFAAVEQKMAAVLTTHTAP